MTEQQNHPTSGRRRRHKSPAVTLHVHDLPLPNLLDHMGAEDGPSCSEEEKRQSDRDQLPPHLDLLWVFSHATMIGL